MAETKNCLPAQLILLCFLIQGFSVGLLAEEKAEEVDPLAVAGVLIRDNKLDRALSYLKKFTPSSEEEKAVYFKLLGTIYMEKEEFEKAFQFINQSLAIENSPEVHLYAARVAYGLEKYELALGHIQHQNINNFIRRPVVYLLEANCLWKLGRIGEAWKVLQVADEIFGFNPALKRQKLIYLIELKLFQAAFREALSQVKQGVPIEETLFAAFQFREQGKPKMAIRLLEARRLVNPDSALVVAELAHVYRVVGSPRVAADLFTQAAALDSRFAFEASEMLIRVGDYTRAVFMNGLVRDQKKKLRQRFALFLKLKDFEQAALMEPRLRRLDLLADQEIRYALGFAYLKQGNYVIAGAHVDRISRPDLFSKKTKLRQAIERCSGGRWICGAVVN